MPYTVDSPPEAVKGLPKHAIEIFVAAFNSAFAEYKGDEGKSMGTAWAAVKTKYEKKGDKWVAKESKQEVPMSKEVLQSKYAEIIQEAGKRNKVEDDKVKVFLAGCTALLADDSPQDAKIGALLKEADVILVWLKEQASFKTEDGVEYPAAAFAYTPDKELPSGWKLRLWEDPEKKVTRTQLGRAAAALSPGGFRGQKVEIPSADLPAVKRKIRVEYSKLDVPDEEIPRWVKESESRTLLVDYIPLTEAKIGTKGKALITIIKPGFNSSKERYYPAETLARDYKVFEGLKMYADHPTPTEEKERPEGSIRNWVATLQNVRPSTDGMIVGEATIVEPWMQEKLTTLRDNSMLKDMGISINAVGSASRAEIEGVKTNFIERIVRARSVDFVTEAGAGGGIQLYEANQDLDIDLVGLETLKERRPDLVKSIESAIKAEISMEVKKKMELEEQIKEKDTAIEALTKERDELKVKITEADKARAKAEAQAIIKEAIAKAELPDAAKKKLTEQFKEAEKADGVTEAIKAEADYIAKLAEAGKVKGMGGSQPNPEKDKKDLRESFKTMHPEWTDAQLEVAVSGR